MVSSGSQSQYQTDSAFSFSVAFSEVKSLGVTVMPNASMKTAQQQQQHAEAEAEAVRRFIRGGFPQFTPLFITVSVEKGVILVHLVQGC